MRFCCITLYRTGLIFKLVQYACIALNNEIKEIHPMRQSSFKLLSNSYNKSQAILAHSKQTSSVCVRCSRPLLSTPPENLLLIAMMSACHTQFRLAKLTLSSVSIRYISGQIFCDYNGNIRL